MIQISQNLDVELQSKSQIIKPKVLAWMADNRYLENVSATTSTHRLRKQISDQSPLLHLYFDKTSYGVSSSSPINRILNYGSAKIDFGIGQQATSGGNFILAVDDSSKPKYYPLSESYYERNEPDRLEDYFYEESSAPTGVPGRLSVMSNSASLDDYDGKFYSWNTLGHTWLVDTGRAVFYDVRNDAISAPAYLLYDVQGVDQYVDFKFATSIHANAGAVVRFIDSDNYIAVQRSGANIIIYERKNGTDTTLATATSTSFLTTKYYRFEAKGNQYTLYDLGTSVPTESTSGSSLLTYYHDEDIFQSEDASSCGAGSRYSDSTSAYVYLDYLAVGGRNYLAKYCDFSSASRYFFADTTLLTNNKDAEFEKLYQIDDFTCHFTFRAPGGGGATQTIFWLGSEGRKTSIHISYISSTKKIRVIVFDADGTTSTTLNSTSSFSGGTTNQITLRKSGLDLRLFVNGTSDANTTLTTGFELFDISTVGDPAICIGADIVGTALGDASTIHILSGGLSEFAFFGSAISNNQIKAFYDSFSFGGELPAEVTDDYFSAPWIYRPYMEETLSIAVANSLQADGNIATTSYSSYTANEDNDLLNNYYWSTRQQSDNAGAFSNDDYFIMSFDSHPCNKIIVTTGYKVGAVASFTLEYGDASGAIDTDTYTFDGASYKEVDLPQKYDITYIKVTILTTVNPYDFGRIYGVNAIWEVDLSDYVISFEVSKTRDNYDATLPIGATSASSANLNLDNTEKLFLPFGDSPYKDYVNPDTVFFISTSHYIKKTSEYEEVVIGQYFYADDWSFSESSMTASVSMRDHSKYLQEEDAGSYFNQYINAGKACSEIVASNGVPARKISFIDTYRNTIAEDNPFCFMPLNEKSERLSVGGALYSESGDDSNERGYEITGSVGNYRKIDRFYNIGLVDLSDNICTITKTDNYSIGSTLVPSEYLSYQKDTVRSAVEDSTFFSKSIETGSYGGTDVDIALKYIRNYPTDTPFTEVPFSFFDLSDWSLEFHFALNPTYTTVGSSYINLFYENATNGSISIAYKPKSSTKIDFKISLVNTSATTFSIEEVDLDRNSTHLITVVRSSTGSNTLKLYLDGELVGTQTLTGSFSSSGSSSGFAFAANNNCLVSYLSVFKYSLSADQIEKHNLSAKIYLTNVFNALYNFDNTYWDGMLEIATADLGMFYFDEYGVFNYEHRTSLHDANLSRYQVSQYDLSDDVNIISGDQRSEVQANKVTVNISSKSARSSELMSLWRPEEGESLAVTTITSDVSPYSDSIILANADDPYWIPEGYVKIDDEIIRYNYIFGNTISSLERGMFGTAASWHQSGSKARETRVYNAEFTDVPAVDVRYPLIAAEYFDGLAEIDYYTSTPSGAYIIVSATESNDAGDLVILEGNDPISDKRNYFSIAGYAFKETDAAEVYETPTAENEQSIRRYRVKELVISNQFIDSKPYAKILADHILGYYSSPVSILNLSVTGIPQLQLGDLITVTNFASLGITAQKFWVIENNISYDGGLVQDLVLRAYADTITPPSLTIQSRGFVEGNSGIIFYPTGP